MGKSKRDILLSVMALVQIALSQFSHKEIIAELGNSKTLDSPLGRLARDTTLVDVPKEANTPLRSR